MQNLDIPLGCFFSSTAKIVTFADQFEPPICVLTLLCALLHNIKIFKFSMDCNQIRFCAQ